MRGGSLPGCARSLPRQPDRASSADYKSRNCFKTGETDIDVDRGVLAFAGVVVLVSIPLAW